EVDIYDIPIADVTDQYMAYLDTMQQFQPELASEFLVMAASLLEMKSKMLLPQTKETSLEELLESEEEHDPRQELMERLVIYRKYKAMAEQLKGKEAEQSRLYGRPAQDLSLYRPAEEELALEGVSLFDLVEAVNHVLRHAKVDDEPHVQVHRDEVSVTDRIDVITRRIVEVGSVLFSELFQGLTNRTEIVTSFMAILEMMAK